MLKKLLCLPPFGFLGTEKDVISPEKSLQEKVEGNH